MRGFSKNLVSVLLFFCCGLWEPAYTHAKQACIQPGMFDDLLRPSKWGTNKHLNNVSNALRKRLGAINQSIDIGNVGIAKVSVDGNLDLDGLELVAHNGPISVRGTVEALKDNAPRVFSYPKINTRGLDPWARRNDAEAKILESIAPKLTRQSRGTIVIYSEKPLCFSCAGVIKQFKEKFPNITIDVKVHMPNRAFHKSLPRNFSPEPQFFN